MNICMPIIIIFFCFFATGLHFTEASCENCTNLANDEYVYCEPACSTAGPPGCNAASQGQDCRFCGFGDHDECPKDSCNYFDPTRDYWILTRRKGLAPSSNENKAFVLERLEPTSDEHRYTLNTKQHGRFSIARKGTNWVWQIADGNVAGGTELSFSEGQNEQKKWYIEPAEEEGYCRLKNAATLKYADGRNDEGSKVMQRSGDGKRRQDWLIVPVPLFEDCLAYTLVSVDRKVQIAYIDSQSSASSGEECIQICANTLGCNSLSFNSNGTCLLSTAVYSVVIFKPASGWTSYGRVPI